MIPNSNTDLNPSTQDNASNGLIARVVENWLTNATERGYQLAFCQLLAAEGEEILYIASHGPFEKGKDVISRGPDNSIRAYQLKGGNIKLGEWRSIKGQINDLVELPINLPQCPPDTKHMPFIVTNGRLDDVVLDHISTSNLGWQQRNFAYPLVVIEQSQLVHRFVAAHGAYLPHEVHDFQQFLTLLMSDGRAPLDKAAFSLLLQSVIILQDGATNKNVSRSLASAVLLTSYIQEASEKLSNHWNVFEGWTVTASYILAAATKFDLAEELWRPSFDLVMLGANLALSSLVEECKIRENFIQGPAIVEGFFYGSRQLILAGLLSAWALARRSNAIAADRDVQKLILARVRESFVWGESAAPFLLLTALELEQQCKQPLAERFIFDYLQLLILCHAEGNRGLPDSFTSIEDSVRFMHRIGEQDVDSFQGFSYTAQTAIDFLARRWRRRALSSVWEGITRISLEVSTPQLTWEWFFWESDSAVLESAVPSQPQSWATLISDAEIRHRALLPPLLLSNREFALFFALVFPHRCTPAIFATLDKQTDTPKNRSSNA